jgi:hypothetical protein
MALTADIKVDERLGGKRFAYGLKAGVKLYRGSVIAVTSAGLVVRAGDAGAAAIVGISPSLLDNTAGADGAMMVEPRRGVLQLTVPSATPANIGAAVYATDDGTLTLTASTNLKLGTLVGFEAGASYVEV